MPEKKLYPSTTSPVIEAITGKLFSFNDRKQALDKISYIRERFIISNEQESKDSVLLWIKGFMINALEKKAGYAGNFAKITIQELANERWTLVAEKQSKDISSHPQRIREKKDVPDWGHFVLRKIRKKKVFTTIEEAAEQLRLLHEEFPACSIPGNHKLYTFIYRKPKNGKAGAVKYILLIKALPEGGFIIEYKLNTRESKKKKVLPQVQDSKQKKPAGYFSSKEILRKK